MQVTVLIKRTRSHGNTTQPELPNKKVQVSKVEEQDNSMVEAVKQTPPIQKIFIVWNCHELENLCTGKELEVVIRAKDPSVVFITETWVDEARLKDIQQQIDFENLFLWKEIIEEVDWHCTGETPLI